jgi:hypothetical protein
MVLRLGSGGKGSETQFALVRASGHLRDFFIHDSEIEQNSISAPFLPSSRYIDIFPFTLFPNPSETNLVNFSLASGAVQDALEIEEKSSEMIPATGSTKATFDFYPHRNLQVPLTHQNGQIQVDAIIMGRRSGVQELFVIEAKVGPKNKTLAKHKLLYAACALAPQVPQGIRIVPTYIKFMRTDSGLKILLGECVFDGDPKHDILTLSEMRLVKTKVLTVPHSVI